MEINHVKGNVLSIYIPLTVKITQLVEGVVTTTTEDFYPSADYDTIITLKKQDGCAHGIYKASISGNVAHIVDMGTLPVGVYQLEVKAYDDSGNPYRYMVESIVDIVDATASVGITAGVEFNAESYTLDAVVFSIAKGEKGDKGDKGDAFTYEDFTEEQIAELQKPATDIAEEVAAAEALRVSAEEARESAEASRVSAENARANAEATRVSNDSARAAAETVRDSNERARQLAEVSRAEAEAARENSESVRESAEQDREAAETERASAENERVSNENTRIANEEARQSNETTRQAQETTRQTQTAQAIANAETATDRANAAAALNEELNEHPMIIGTNGNWWSWDADNDEYADTGTPSTNILAFGYDETTGEVFMDVVESSDYPNFAVENGDLVLEID